MTPTLFLTESTHLLETSTGAFELPTGANDNISTSVQTTLEEFKSRLLETTGLTVVESQVSSSKTRAIGVLEISELGELTEDEKITLRLATFFGTAHKAIELIRKDRAANDNTQISALAA